MFKKLDVIPVQPKSTGVTACNQWCGCGLLSGSGGN